MKHTLGLLTFLIVRVFPLRMINKGFSRNKLLFRNNWLLSSENFNKGNNGVIEGDKVMIGGFLPVPSPSGKPWLFKGLPGGGYKIMYQSVPSLTIPPILFLRGSGFRPSVIAWWVKVLNQRSVQQF